MTTVVVGVADEGMSSSLRTTLSEIEGVDIEHVAASTSELAAAVERLRPGVVFVHDQLGPDPVWPLIRELSFRLPSCSVLVVSANPTAEVFARALDVGARGVVASPVSYEDVRGRLADASQWAAQMQRLLPGMPGDDERGAVIAFVGAKGGVGTTTIATHLALDAVRSSLGRRVCLVDLDLEKGDVTGLLEVRHGRSIADLAKVAADLSPFSVPDAVVAHESGLHVLLTPGDVREVESVTLVAVRQILSVLRREYDLVVVDAGSHVTPMQATVVDVADELVAVVTPDVLCLRSLRRAVSAWESLGVRREADVRVLLNRTGPGALSHADVGRMVQSRILAASLPAAYRRLEPAMNARDPLVLRDRSWSEAVRAVSREVGMTSGRSNGSSTVAVAGRPAAHRRGRRRGDSGSVALETIGLLPLVLGVALLCWQVVLVALTFVWSGHAAGAGARALSIGDDPGPAARASVPSGLRSTVSVDPEKADGSGTVTVTLGAPLVAPGFATLPFRIESTRQVVVEP